MKKIAAADDDNDAGARPTSHRNHKKKDHDSDTNSRVEKHYQKIATKKVLESSRDHRAKKCWSTGAKKYCSVFHTALRTKACSLLTQLQ